MPWEGIRGTADQTGEVYTGGPEELPIRTTTVPVPRATIRPPRASLTLAERWRILVAGDLAFAGLGAVCALVFWAQLDEDVTLRGRAAWLAILAGSWMVASLLLGSYVQPHLHRTVRSWSILVATAGLVFAGYSIVYFFAPRSGLPRLVVLVCILATTVLVAGWRRVWAWASGHDSMKRPIVIVGAGHQGKALAQILALRPSSGYRVIGFIDDDPAKQGTLVQGVRTVPPIPVTGSSSSLLDLVEEKNAVEVVLAFGGLATPELVQAALACYERGIVVTSASDLFEASTGRMPTSHIGENWRAVLPLAHPGSRALYLAAKRIVDVVGATVGLVSLGLMLPLLAFAIKLDSHGPVIYGQLRTGRGGRPFTIWKFRTMAVGAEAEGPVWCAPSDPRMTRVGRWLRRTHLDELPQLWNVLKGEMSLVGPRPERPEIDQRLEEVIPFYRLRLSVKPGIAGWGAVNTSYVDGDEKAIERLEYDLYYIKHQSLWLDLQIMMSAGQLALFVRGR